MREAYAWSWRDEILKCIYGGCCTCHSKRKLHVKKPTLIRWSLIWCKAHAKRRTFSTSNLNDFHAARVQLEKNRIGDKRQI